MADPPVVFKRSAKKHLQRARVSTPELPNDNEKDTTADSEQSPSILATKLKTKLRSTTKSRLSFGGDEEEGDGEVFQVKKSSLSKKLTLGKHPASPGNILPSSFTPARPSSNLTPVYDAAYLSELKANTPTARPSLPADTSMYDADVSMDMDTLQQSISSVIDITGDDSETAIPSGSSILAAKQKRERLRTAEKNGNEDYISLSVTKRSDYPQGPHPESRLMREEDELGEADDEYAEFTSAQERIALGKKSRKVEARKKREEMYEMIVDAEEEDEETMEWEQEQLRRGGLRADESAGKAPKPIYKPAPIPPVTEIPTLSVAVARLTQSLTALTTSHAQNSQAMASIGEEQVQLEVREKEMREMIAKAEGKRSWFAAFREWVESVATFLDEKYPRLEKLEDDQVSLLKERAEMIAQRRRAEDEDDLSLFLGSLPKEPPKEDDLDELGRVIPQANPASARRDRQSARAARRTRRRASGRKQPQDEEEGYSTDSSLLPSDAADYSTAVAKVLHDGRDIMSDVKAEEFQDPLRGLGKWFGDWREKFGDSYTGAWGGLGMVGAWEFWVRLELLGWSPLEDPRTLDDFMWYKSLYLHSHPHGQSDEDGDVEMGPDGDLVSAMISTAVIPRLCKLIEAGGFDPYSAKDLRRLTDLAEQVEASVEKNSLKFELLLKAALNVFQAAVVSTESFLPSYLALNRPRFDPEAIPARRRFLARRYKLLRNVVTWRKYSGERYGIGQLATRLVDNCMLPVADSGWEVGGEDAMHKVVQILPSELASRSLKVRVGAA